MDNPDQQQTPSGRPQLLTVICILSFIGSGLAGMSYFMVYASYEEVIPMMKEMTAQFPGFEMILNAGKNFFLAGFILYFLSLFGISLMWRLRKAGFHFYAGSQVAILLLPLIYIKGYPIPYLDGIVTVLFIYLYSRFIRIFV